MLPSDLAKWLRMFSWFRLRSLGLFGSGTVMQDLSVLIIVHRRNQWIHNQIVFIGSFDAPWSRQIMDHWSWSRSPQRNTPFVYQFWLETSDNVFFGFPCIIQDNLLYLTINNKFIICREIGKKGQRWGLYHHWQPELKCKVLLIENLMKNDKLFHLQGLLFCLWFLSCCFVLNTTREYISLILESYLWNACSLFSTLKSPCTKKLFLNCHLMVWYLCSKEITESYEECWKVWMITKKNCHNLINCAELNWDTV